uniref:Transcription initiation factor TFIID subunit 8 n=1 Tax=Strongyloides stercoralis TaxID=6248 RepID=A0A0K0E248_STRER
MAFYKVGNNVPTEDETMDKILRYSILRLFNFKHIDETSDNVVSLFINLTKVYLRLLGNLSKKYAEHSGRSDVQYSDVQMSLLEVGTKIEDLTKYMRESSQMSEYCAQKNPMVYPQNPEPEKVIQIGEKKTSLYVPSFLPPFPDPHTYIRTKIQSEPECNYVNVRITEGNNLRTSQESVRDYMLRIHPTIPLFPKYVAKAEEESKLEYYQKKLELCREFVPDFKVNYESNYLNGTPPLEDLEMAEDEFKQKLKQQGLSEHLYYTPISVKQLVFEKVPTFSLLLDPQPEPCNYLRAMLPNDNINEEEGMDI